MYYSAKDLLDKCDKENLPIWKAVLLQEVEELNISQSQLLAKAAEVLEVMKASSTNGLDKPVFSLTEMTGGEAYKLYHYSKSQNTICDPQLIKSMAMALSTSETNSAMGKIVAAPTAGASGILPSTLLSLQENKKINDQQLIQALFTASGIGEIIARNASISGAVGGCQAECGSASAMAAAAAVELMGGSPKQALHAASFSLINVMGLVCDPIAGLVEFPCALRNASGVTNALISADLALAGIESLIPFDEVVDTMYHVGKQIPYTLKETALGGLAATPTGKKLQEKYLEKLKNL